jgi:hypothetical protein
MYYLLFTNQCVISSSLFPSLEMLEEFTTKTVTFGPKCGPNVKSQVQRGWTKCYCSGHQEPEYSRGRLCKALGSWGSGNLEGRGGLGREWVKVGRFITNLGLRWTFLSQLEGAK